MRSELRRERAPDPRGHEAAESDWLADERERLADDRERLADDRERLADEREHEADEREQLADRREQRLDELAHELAVLVTDRHKRAQEAIERSRATMAAARERLDRSDAALLRSEASVVRTQAQAERAAAEGERERARQPPGADVPAEPVTMLRRRLSVQSASLATALEELAQAYEKLTARNSPQASEYRGSAEAARKAAHQVREIGRLFSGRPGQPGRHHRGGGAACLAAGTAWRPA